MKIYLITVRRWWMSLAAMAILCLTCQGVGSKEVPVPNLLSNMGGVPVRYFAPLLPVFAVMYCLERRIIAVERTAVARIMLLDCLVITGFVLALHLIIPVIGMAVARNSMLLLAIALLVRALSNEAAAGAVCLMLLLCIALTGRSYDHVGLVSARWWALPLQPANSIMAWGIAFGIYVALVSLSSVIQSRRNSGTNG